MYSLKTFNDFLNLNTATYKELINESKQIGLLYHILNFNKLIFVANNNILQGRDFYKLSFTRNKMLNYYVGEGAATFCKFEIDGNKLSNKYKIEPFQYQTHNGKPLKEFEETVDGPIKNFFNYVNKLIFIKERINDMMFIEKESKNKSKLSDALEIIKNKYKIEFFVQDGTKIIKDDKFLEQFTFISNIK